MNEWIKKSIDLANGYGYLDKLSDVYPVTLNAPRPLSADEKMNLKNLFDKKDYCNLIRKLLDFDKFPIKDPYVAFFKRNLSAIDSNPQTVKRISDTLHQLGFEALIKGLEEPKEFNRQIGTLFQTYPTKLGYPILEENQFKTFSDGIAILKGSDSTLKLFAKNELGYNIDKGIDLVAKVNDKYVIGEAKFLTDYGGHQNAQFEDALRLLRDYDGNAIAIAILDGVVWMEGRTKMFRTVSTQESPILSALLLQDFLENLR